ncbi:MAG TPA: CoA-binding protein [Polyangiaceae bacterium]|nr:CoA-binding protein [Polyangiaceae bacterium]
MSDRQGRLIESADDIAELLRTVTSVAVLGIKTEAQADQPAHYVPAYCQRAGLEVIPVPVYYPEAKSILGQPVYRTLAAIERAVDLVNVFRRPADVDQHVDDIVAKRPRAVWLQSGIRNDAAAARLVRAGIDVVQDRCLMVELRRLGR